ncbi:DUF6745 domain-containing protein [Micromonospora luteifusca]|uniref:DUF6745 domain-containing protein n=1 Tax=Micromonospora luteifusca TaxID=709860 RepID=UPI0035562C5A
MRRRAPAILDEGDFGDHRLTSHRARCGGTARPPRVHAFRDLWPSLLAAIDTYRNSLGAGADPAWQGCRDVVLTSGPWWPFPDIALMSERPILLTLDEQGRLHGDDGPAVQGADGHPVMIIL